MITILMMSQKMATLGFLKIKLFWNKSYDQGLNRLFSTSVYTDFCHTNLGMPKRNLKS